MDGINLRRFHSAMKNRVLRGDSISETTLHTVAHVVKGKSSEEGDIKELVELTYAAKKTTQNAVKEMPQSRAATTNSVVKEKYVAPQESTEPKTKTKLLHSREKQVSQQRRPASNIFDDTTSADQITTLLLDQKVRLRLTSQCL
jgi:hypothetical protein